jgi:Xaa-Pro aminopeptidase
LFIYFVIFVIDLKNQQIMFTKEVYLNRRERLCNQMISGILLFPGNSESPMSYTDNAYPFRQDSNFLYFAGIDHPDLFFLMDLDSKKFILFGDELTVDDIIWTGPQKSLNDQAAEVGIQEVMPLSAIFNFIGSALAKKREVHFLPPYRTHTMLLLENITGIKADQQKMAASNKLIHAVIALRSIKGTEEIEDLQKASAIGYAMHYAAMKKAVDGASEREIAGYIEGIALSMGSGISFPVILSQQGEILHGHDHSQILHKGHFMLCDAGAESLNHYASDFTRTTPVGGRFTSQQKELYQLVLDANNEAFQLIRPGALYRDIHLNCCQVLAEGLKSLGILKGNMEEAVVNGAHALFMVHGLGHMLGLDVHDMEELGEDFVGYDEEISRSSQFGLSSLRLGRRLQPGFALTVEPGLYFIPALIQKWESEKKLTDYINYNKIKQFIGIGGIRLEDNVLVTMDGCKMLGEKRLPISPAEIEALF